MSALLYAFVLVQAMGGRAPDARLTPQQVVEIVAGALQHNNSPLPNAGVFTAYRFASPANHVVTGPYGHFLRNVKAPLFAPMLGDHRAEVINLAREHGRASQILRILTDQGKPVEYRWELTLQEDGPYRGCWMVDGVSRLP